MSLFLRLWMVASLTAFASAAAAVVIFAVVTAQGREAVQVREAVSLARSVAFAAAMQPLDRLEGVPARELLRRRADGLLAMGSTLFLAIVAHDGEPVADLAAPGLEEESVLRTAAGLVEAARRSGYRQVERRGAVLYVALPIVDAAERERGVLGVGVPVHTMRDDRGDVAVFAMAAAGVAAVLGLLAAAVLTRQVGRPIRRLSEVAGRLEDAAFDASAVDALVGRSDEIGSLARVMLRLVRALDHLGRRMDAEVDREAAP